MAKRKHVPQRMCVICRRKYPKRALTRIVRTPEEGVQIDDSGKLPGRGAYVCDNPDCWQTAARSSVLNNALRTTLTDDERAAVAAHGEQNATRQETDNKE